MNNTIDYLEGYWCDVIGSDLVMLSEIPWSKGVLNQEMIIDKSFCIKNTSPVPITLIGMNFLFWVGLRPSLFGRTYSIFQGVAGADRKLKQKLTEEKFSFSDKFFYDWDAFQTFDKNFFMILNPGEYFVLVLQPLYARFSMTLKIRELKPLVFDKPKPGGDKGDEDENKGNEPNIEPPKVPFDWKNFIRYMVVSILIGILGVMIYMRIQKIRAQL